MFVCTFILFVIYLYWVMKMIFVIDLDDTVCETNEYSEYYIKKFIKENNLPYSFVQSKCRFAESKFDWDKDTALTWYKTYGDQMMLEFSCKKYAVGIINKLFDAGHTIIIATARATDWHTNPEEVTLQWLDKVGLKYNKIYMGRVDKEKICEEEHADVFVDDDLKITGRVAEYFAKSSKVVYLMTTDYNRDLPHADGIVRVNDFVEIYNDMAKRQNSITGCIM